MVSPLDRIATFTDILLHAQADVRIHSHFSRQFSCVLISFKDITSGLCSTGVKAIKESALALLYLFFIVYR